MLVPEPTADVLQRGEKSRVYAKFEDVPSALAAYKRLNGRTFDTNKVVARFAGDAEFDAAERGEWPPASAV